METTNLTVAGEWTLVSDGLTNAFISAVNAAGYSPCEWAISDMQPDADVTGHPIPSDGIGFKTDLMVWVYTRSKALIAISYY